MVVADGMNLMRSFLGEGKGAENRKKGGVRNKVKGGACEAKVTE